MKGMDAMKEKITYKVKNWSEYNKSLIKRGNITVWFDDSCIKKWTYKLSPERRRGKPSQYSDFAIECALTFRSLYRLPLRATQGFLEGLKRLLNLNISIPDYTTFSRRAKTLKIDLFVSRKSNEKIDLVIDSTGLKVYGEGEWKTKIHGKGKRRTWRKLHIAVDPVSHETISMELTENSVHDSKPFPKLIESQNNITNIYADGAYDYPNCFDAIHKIGSKALIALRAVPIAPSNPSQGLLQRNRIINEITLFGGKEEWKKKSGYHKRSLVETQMFRYKAVFGGNLQSRKMLNQITESKLKLSILNRMTQLGMPISLKS